MKKLITVLTLVFLAGVFSTSAQCCKSNKALAQANATSESLSDAKQTGTNITAYYFHATRRCATCEAVEKVTKETIAKNYKGKVVFESINREKEKDNPLVQKYKISGQTLLLVKGDKKKDMTSAAFMNARNNPEKFETKLKAAIDSML